MTSSLFKFKVILIVSMLSMLIPTLCSALYVVPDARSSTVKQLAQSEQLALLVYGGFDDPQNDRKELITLYNLVRTYCSKVSLIRLDDYHKGMLDGTQYIFLAGVREDKPNAELASDLKSFGGVISWIGGGIESYASYGINAGFAITDYSNEIVEMQYTFNTGEADRQTILLGKPGFVPQLTVTDQQTVQTVGEISDGVNKFPYAVHSSNVWNITTYGQGGADGAVFRDMMSRVFTKPLAQTPHVYIKLANVSPLINLAKLEETGLWLGEQGVSFMIELRPVFVNLEYKPMISFFETVKQLQKQGGTAVLQNLQGWSPPDEWQADIESVSATNEKPELVQEKLMDTSLHAYLLHNIYPLALSGPPDIIFDPGFTGVLGYFSTFVQSGSWQGYARDLTPADAWTGVFLNEIRSAEGSGINDTAIELPEEFASLRGTNGATVIKFDSTEDWKGLKEAVLYLKQIGATFEDLRKVNSHVQFGDTRIDIESGHITVNGKVFDGEKLIDTSGLVEVVPPTSAVNKRVKQTMLFILGLAGVFVLMFVVALFASKRIDRKKYMG